MRKKILSIFLLAFLVVSFAVPAYADSEELNTVEVPVTDPQVQAVNEAIERLDLPADISEETVIEALEAEGIDARADKFAYVFDFAGLEAAFADEDVNIILLLADIQMEYELTIDRDISMSGVMGSMITSNGRHFVVESPEDVDLVFSNIILDGGNTSGGILLCTTTYLKGAILQNCLSSSGAITTRDTGSYTTVNENITPFAVRFILVLEDCVITDNTSMSNGGGINAEGTTSFVIRNCEISRNSTLGDGGGIYTINSAAIENSIIADNSATLNGGGIAVSVLNINSSQIINNSAGQYGGGIAYAHTSLSDSSVTNNQAQFGGGMYLLYGGGIFENADISHNSAVYGGAIYTYPNFSQTISGGIIENNSADFGGAIYCDPVQFIGDDGTIWDEGFVQLSNIQLRDNSATESGGAVYIDESKLGKLTVDEDVIFSGNTADKGYYITDPDDIAIHDTHVFTTHFSEPFTQYAYNNFDISYTKGEEVPTVTASFYLRYSDAEPYETALVYAGQTLGDKLLEGPEQSGLKFIGWVDINGMIYNGDTVIAEDVNLYPAYILD